MTTLNTQIPIIGFTAPSGSGKTTLLKQVISLLSEQGFRVGVIKQARDDFDLDQPGKDSYELRKAGIERLMLASEQQSALVLEHPHADDPQLADLVALLDQDSLDLILVEGFSEQPFPKIVLSRQGHNATPLIDHWVIALATDTLKIKNSTIPRLDINDPAAIAEFITARLESTVLRSQLS